MVAHTCSLSPWKVKAKGLGFRVILSYIDKFEASMGYMRYCLKNKKSCVFK